MKEDRLLTIKASALVLSVSKPKMYQLVNNGEIEAVLVAGHLKIKASTLQKFIRELSNAKPVHFPGRDDELDYVLNYHTRTGQFPVFKLADNA